MLSVLLFLLFPLHHSAGSNTLPYLRKVTFVASFPRIVVDYGLLIRRLLFSFSITELSR